MSYNRDRNTGIPDILKQYLYFARNYLIDEMNACSVIFHKPEKLIFFGDSTGEVIDHLVQNGKIRSYYPIVKIQHHRTKKHFTKRTPEAGCYLISNGNYKNREIGQSYFSGMCDCIYYSDCGIDRDKSCEFYQIKRHCNPLCVHTKMISI